MFSIRSTLPQATNLNYMLKIYYYIAASIIRNKHLLGTRSHVNGSVILEIIDILDIDPLLIQLHTSCVIIL